MHPFDLRSAVDASGALMLHGAAERATEYIAGGTSIIDLMKLNVQTPARLVDINRLPLKRIEQQSDGGLRIGALVSNTDLAYDGIVRSNYPVLAEALLAGASPQLRNMATAGGNLLQKTRCYYYRDTALPCNRREPGTGCPAIAGYNRVHAILGGSAHCIAAHPSDMCVALVALDAVVHTQNLEGERDIPIAEFHRLPGDTPHFETVLEPGELITWIQLPASSFAAMSHYVKVRDRASYAFALASVAVALEMRGGQIRTCRVAFGGVATKPWRSKEAERALVGKTATTETFQAAASAALVGARPLKHNRFKVELLHRTIVRTLLETSRIA